MIDSEPRQSVDSKLMVVDTEADDLLSAEIVFYYIQCLIPYIFGCILKLFFQESFETFLSTEQFSMGENYGSFLYPISELQLKADRNTT